MSGKNKKYSTSWGLFLSIIFHVILIVLIGFWGIQKYKEPPKSAPISVSLSNTDYSGSSDKFSSKPTVAPKKSVKEQKDASDKKQEVKKEEPKQVKIEKKEAPNPVFKQELKKVVKKEVKEPKIKEVPIKNVIPLETKKVEKPKKKVEKKKVEVVKKTSPPKSVKKKEPVKKVVKKPVKSQDTNSERQSVLNDLKRKNILASIKKNKPSTGTGGKFGGDEGGLKGSSQKDKAGSTRINPVLLESYKQVIWKRIKPRFRIPPNIPKDGSLTADVVFDIDYNGRVSNVKVKRTSGNRAFDNFCINTIISSSPLPPPPSDIAKQVVTQGFQLPMANEG